MNNNKYLLFFIAILLHFRAQSQIDSVELKGNILRILDTTHLQCKLDSSNSFFLGLYDTELDAIIDSTRQNVNFKLSSILKLKSIDVIDKKVKLNFSVRTAYIDDREFTLEPFELFVNATHYGNNFLIELFAKLSFINFSSPSDITLVVKLTDNDYFEIKFDDKIIIKQLQTSERSIEDILCNCDYSNLNLLGAGRNHGLLGRLCGGCFLTLGVSFESPKFDLSKKFSKTLDEERIKAVINDSIAEFIKKKYAKYKNNLLLQPPNKFFIEKAQGEITNEKSNWEYIQIFIYCNANSASGVQIVSFLDGSYISSSSVGSGPSDVSVIKSGDKIEIKYGERMQTYLQNLTLEIQKNLTK